MKWFLVGGLVGFAMFLIRVIYQGMKAEENKRDPEKEMEDHLRALGYTVGEKTVRTFKGNKERTLVRYGIGLGFDSQYVKDMTVELQDRQFENIPDARKFVHDTVDELFDAWGKVKDRG